MLDLFGKFGNPKQYEGTLIEPKQYEGKVVVNRLLEGEVSHIEIVKNGNLKCIIYHGDANGIVSNEGKEIEFIGREYRGRPFWVLPDKKTIKVKS